VLDACRIQEKYPSTRLQIIFCGLIGLARCLGFCVLARGLAGDRSERPRKVFAQKSSRLRTARMPWASKNGWAARIRIWGAGSTKDVGEIRRISIEVAVSSLVNRVILISAWWLTGEAVSANSGLPDDYAFRDKRATKRTTAMEFVTSLYLPHSANQKASDAAASAKIRRAFSSTLDTVRRWKDRA